MAIAPRLPEIDRLARNCVSVMVVVPNICRAPPVEPTLPSRRALARLTVPVMMAAPPAPEALLAVQRLALAVTGPVAARPPPLRAVLLRKTTPLSSVLPGLKAPIDNP